MNTSGPSGVTRRSTSEAIDTVSASSHETPSSPERHRRDIQVHGIDQSRFPRRSLKATPPSSTSDMICRSPSRPNASGSAPLRYRLQFGARPLQIPGADAVPLDALGRGDDYHRSRVERREHPGRGRNPQPPVEQDPRQRAAPMELARRQQRIVGEDGPGADRDRVDLGAHGVRVPQRIVRADARALPRLRRHAIVEARRGFHDDERPMQGLEREIRAVQPERPLAAGSHRHVDALLTQKIEPAATDARIGVDCRRNHARDAGRRNTFDARAGSADVAARLERAVERRAARESPRLVERAHFRVRPACLLVISLSDDRAVLAQRPPRRPSDSDWSSPGPARRDRARDSCTRGQRAYGSRLRGSGFRVLVRVLVRVRTSNQELDPEPRPRTGTLSHHFVSNNASTYSSTLNGMRSSIVSPTPT